MDDFCKMDNKITNSNNEIEKEIKELKDKLNNLNRILEMEYEKSKVILNEKNQIMQSYDLISNSTCWKITKPIRMLKNYFIKKKNKIKNIFFEVNKVKNKTFYCLKSFGIRKTIYKIVTKGKDNIQNIKKSNIIAEKVVITDIWANLEKWIDETPHEFIDIFHVAMGWNTPLFQRFQHISLQAGSIGGISIYGAHPSVDKDVEVYKFITPTLCIVNLDNYQVKQKLFDILDRKEGLKYIRLQSIDLATTIEEIESYLSRGYEIVYEYIDELTPQITGSIPQFVLDRHDYILKNEKIIVIATSDKLYNQVSPYRKNNMEMINNGVDYDHWNIKINDVECPKDIIPIVQSGKIIIGYHGALAQWIDYKLLKRIADDKQFIILLIGYMHDDNLKNSGLLNYDNVYYIGPKPYNVLNNYAVFYDIAILPFLINEITLSVSPVKIFEYMALEKPVVTYALPECLKYQSCLNANNQDEFIDKIYEAMNLVDNTEYLKLLRNDALNNTWKEITQRTVNLVKKNHLKKVNEYEYKAPNDVMLEANHSIIKKKDIINHNASDSYKNRYINQILRIPDKDLNEYIPITTELYTRKENDCKVIAYYLTQFHPDKHNEEWWGRGVTEWNNVIRAVPQYLDHYQPRQPGELGFYDLRITDNMKRQIELAKMYGIYGFSFYYYWFNGERLLEKPLEDFLNDKSLQFPFSLCWANENWTKRFDGTNYDILMEQPKSVESYKEVIHDIIRFLRDDRYIAIKGKKLITVYRPSLMPKVKAVLEYWRKYCREQGIGELYIIAVKENMVVTDWIKEGYDAISEFHPGTLYTNCKNISNDLEYIRKDFAGEVYDYKDIVINKKYFNYNYPKLYRAVMPMWDNTARRNNKGMIFHGSTPKLYKQWLKDVILEEKNREDLDDSLIFINAWNEWGEGAYLEPDKRFGYAYLQATKDAIEEARDNYIPCE